MTKNMLTYISHQFCVNCCGESEKNDCDIRNITCDKLASFLVGCHKFQEPIDEDKLDELTLNYFNKQWSTSYKSLSEIFNDLDLCAIEDFKAGYRKAMEE